MTARRGVAVLVVVVVALVVAWRWHARSASQAPVASAGSAAHAGHSPAPTRATDIAGRKIAGVVTRDGKPAAATVRLVGIAAQQRTTTDASGHFTFEHVPIAEYTLVAEQPGATGAML
ncbi:MAG: carboxypeptidase regulatory-like domain-containing protein, partial [Deltaproteobacteria bacterium]|nr:carboxypeptidase regulatory-like domain-containing protein [Deltaproteobacteria bacterium]